MHCLKLIKEESLFFEWNLKVENILLELAQLCFLQAEYRSRVDYKYLNSQQLMEITNNHEATTNYQNQL